MPSSRRVHWPQRRRPGKLPSGSEEKVRKGCARRRGVGEEGEEREKGRRRERERERERENTVKRLWGKGNPLPGLQSSGLGTGYVR